MKVREQEFLAAIKAKPKGVSVRAICNEFQDADVPPKRLHYWLQKWTGKGWYDYGVAVDLGWLTADGLAVEP